MHSLTILSNSFVFHENTIVIEKSLKTYILTIKSKAKLLLKIRTFFYVKSRFYVTRLKNFEIL